MTPHQKIKNTIFLKAVANGDAPEGIIPTAETIDALYEEHLEEKDAHYDYESEMRGGEVETDIECEWSRHYESKSVAAKMSDGSWVGWTYWYGGGKHGEPEAIDWMDDAYNLDCKEEEKLVTVQTFTKAQQ